GATVLTGRQLMMTTTRRPPPYRVQELRNIFDVSDGHAYSLRNIIDGVQKQKLLFFMQVRDITLLTASATFEELNTSWKSSTPSVATLKQLASILANFGASIVIVSTDRKVVGISGHVEGLLTMPSMHLTPKTIDQAKEVA